VGEIARHGGHGLRAKVCAPKPIRIDDLIVPVYGGT
jgi:hypothetical protein